MNWKMLCGGTLVIGASLQVGCATGETQPERETQRVAVAKPLPIMPESVVDVAVSTDQEAQETATDMKPVREPEPPIVLDPFEQRVELTTVAFDMRGVPGGTVSVLNEQGEQVEVEVEPFWIATTEVPWELYDIYVFRLDEQDGAVEATANVTRPSRPYVAPDRGYGHNGYPTISVAYKGAVHFCEWLSAKTGRDYRVPTEAQWKLACQLGGVQEAEIDAHAWHDGNADGTPHPVGEKKPDALGLYDMHGNVREWATTIDDTRIALGGSFRDELKDIGCAGRMFKTDAWQETDPQFPKSPWWLSDAEFMGFRIVCIPGDE